MAIGFGQGDQGGQQISQAITAAEGILRPAHDARRHDEVSRQGIAFPGSLIHQATKLRDSYPLLGLAVAAYKCGTLTALYSYSTAYTAAVVRAVASHLRYEYGKYRKSCCPRHDSISLLVLVLSLLSRYYE
eukprot:scaffold439533_cov44-Prasinocladus_malaysianus.AAC.1